MSTVSSLKTCVECGHPLKGKIRRQRGACSHSCEVTARERNPQPGVPESTCPYCRRSFWTKRKKKYCCGDCANRATASARELDRGGIGNKFKRAFLDSPEAFFELLKEHSSVTSSGCWEFPCASSSSYATVMIDGKTRLVHRLALEVKLGAPLGVQAAHHMCANRICVNPGHLQPVTYYENTAEMLARKSYIARISELEEALRVIDPSHPVLDCYPLAGA